MGFFSRRPEPQNTGRQGPYRKAHTADDQLILEIGRTTDEVLRNVLRESRESATYIRQYLAEQSAADAAWWASWRRQEAEDLEHSYPGYRQELNIQRAALGLPPI